MINQFVIILAAGIGSRLGGILSKQFVEVDHKPVVIRTLDVFMAHFPKKNIRIVINEQHRLIWQNLLSKYNYLSDIQIVRGGEERFFSVKNALDTISCREGDLIGIHDAVRPFVSEQTIKNAYASAALNGSGIPVFDSVNTLRVVERGCNRAINRAMIKEVQNPQVFRSSLIKKAYQRPYHPDFLDDATVAEADGNLMHICQGNYENIKITHPQDLFIAQAFAQMLVIENDTNHGEIHHNKRTASL